MWFLFIFLGTFVCAQHTPVLLRDVEVVTGVRGRLTQGRRSSPVNQLFCEGANCHVRDAVSSIQCKNSGFNGKDVEWKCEAANMPNGYDLDTTVVTCEGYGYPEDKFILQGSCGIEYTVKRNLQHTINGPLGSKSVNGPKGVNGYKNIIHNNNDAHTGMPGICIDKEHHILPEMHVKPKDSEQSVYGIFFFGTAIVLITSSCFFILIICCCCEMCQKSERELESRRSRRRLREENVRSTYQPVPPPVYAPAPPPPVYHQHYETPRSSYGDGYIDSKIDSWLWSPDPVVVRETIVVNNPDPVVVREPAEPETHVSTSHATTRRR